jgi:hypothetical protein
MEDTNKAGEQVVSEPQAAAPAVNQPAQLHLQLDIKRQYVILSVNDLHIGMTVKETFTLALELRRVANQLEQLIFKTERLKNKTGREIKRNG